MCYAVGPTARKNKGSLDLTQVIQVRLLTKTYTVPSNTSISSIIELKTPARTYHLAAENDQHTTQWLAMFMELSSVDESTEMEGTDDINLDDITLDSVLGEGGVGGVERAEGVEGGLDQGAPDGTRLSAGGSLAGYLLKRPGRGGNWQRRYFHWSFNTSVITYHASKEEVNKVKGEIDLNTVLSVRLSKANSEISNGLVFELETKKRWWGLAATTDVDMQWFRLIRTHVEEVRSNIMHLHLPVLDNPCEGATISGQLYKRGAINSKWQLRRFMLKHKGLEWKKMVGGEGGRGGGVAGTLDIRHIRKIVRENGLDEKKSKTGQGEPMFVFSVQTRSRKYLMGSPNNVAVQLWIKALRGEMRSTLD